MYIVKHNNPKHPSIINGEQFAYDGVGEEWTEHDAEQFVLRAMYDARKIQYEILEFEGEYDTDDNSDTVQPEPDIEERPRSRRRSTKE